MKIIRTAVAVSVTGVTLCLGLVPELPASAATAIAARSAAVIRPVAVARSAVTARSAAAPESATAARSAPAVRPVVLTCANKPVRRPRNYVLACGDGTDELMKITWASWRRGAAHGHGTEALNDCVPDCAQGTFRDYPVRIVFRGHAAVKGHPRERAYTRYKLTYTAALPGGQPTRTGPLGY